MQKVSKRLQKKFCRKKKTSGISKDLRGDAEMTMKQFYLELAKMNAWANSLIRQTIRDLSPEVLEIQTNYTPYGSLGNLFIHIFNTPFFHFLLKVFNK